MLITRATILNSQRFSSRQRNSSDLFNCRLISEEIAPICKRMTIILIYKNISIDKVFEIFYEKSKNKDNMAFLEITQTLQEYTYKRSLFPDPRGIRPGREVLHRTEQQFKNTAECISHGTNVSTEEHYEVHFWQLLLD
jgi:hypothetical protein